MIHPQNVSVLILALFGLTPIATIRADEPEKPYAELLAAARKDPEKADFKALRLAYTKTAEYKPYSVEPPDRSGVIKALEADDTKATLEAIDQLLKGREVDARLHAFAAAVCDKLGEQSRTDFHKLFMKKIVDTILRVGDGKSEATAWPVLTIDEEYLVLEAYGWTFEKQILRAQNDHFYDVMTIKDKAGELRDVYFNIDLPRKALSRMFINDK